MDKLYGIYKGIVEDNQDPQHRNRLRIRVGVIHGTAKSGIPTNGLMWAHAASPILTDPLPVGTIVYVAFEQGDTAFPIYLGYMLKACSTSQCYKCKHFKGPIYCDAFPISIPDEIYFNEIKHTSPYNKIGISDDGIQFEAK